MKLVHIVVRPSKVEVVKNALSSIGVLGATIMDVRGFGSSKGHTTSYRGSEYVTDTNPKGMLKVACKDDDVENIVEVVRDVANTNSIGDGKIFVTELIDVIRIRTGETGEDALMEKNDD
jgi:nitrogen regulatory protein P-II 2